jgi:predicted nucleic acid-binding protein
MSGYLLDTNVLSELAKPKPDSGVVQFLDELELGYISVLTVHELYYGIELIQKDAERRDRLTRVVEALLETFRDHILPIGQTESRIAASIRANAHLSGRVVHVIDSLIAATALARGLSVVTRNEKDFTYSKASLINPWKG